MSKKMFVRVGKRDMVDRALAMLAQFDPKTEEDGDWVTVYAPDGDIVFQAIPKDDQGNFICRYHEEVFER